MNSSNVKSYVIKLYGSSDVRLIIFENNESKGDNIMAMKQKGRCKSSRSITDGDELSATTSRQLYKPTHRRAGLLMLDHLTLVNNICEQRLHTCPT